MRPVSNQTNSYAHHARETLGVPIVTGFVQDVVLPAGSFDVMAMYHALEHVEDPSAILARLRHWMVDDGLLLIEVPNVEAACIAPGHRFHFAHFYNFNRSTLEALGRKAGFDPLQTRTSPDGGNLTSVFRAAARSQPPGIDRANYTRVAEAVTRHTSVRYYCSASPYIGPFNRLRAYLADRRAANGCGTPRQVLDNLLARSGCARSEKSL